MRAWAGDRWRRIARLGVVGLAGVGLLSLASCVADPAPEIGPAVAANGQATVSWDAPIGDNALALTAYVVTPYAGSVPLPPVRFDSTATTQTVMGLTNGVTYRFAVHGVNALGNDTARSKLSNPVTPTGVVLAAGELHTCAVRGDGTVACWGYNEHGQLGDGTTTDSTTPVSVVGISDAVSVAAGELFSCASLSDGTARCWGLNNFAQLGNGTTGGQSTTPVTVTGLTNAVSITAGSRHACAMLADATARCWGTNSFGELGNGAASPPSNTPVTVTGLTATIAITAAERHTCAVRGDGSGRCWGDNFYGQLGIGTTGGQSATPVNVTGLTDAFTIAAGGVHTCALRRDGTARCWGNNDYGQFGNGTTTGTGTPVLSGFTDAVAVTAGDGGQTCVLLGDGSARCAGRNIYGQLGNGTITRSTTTPVTVSGVTAGVHITAGTNHNCAVLDDGTARCWGHNFKGQIGNGVPAYSTTPVPAVGLTGVTGVAAGGQHSCSLLGDGTGRCWGGNNEGQLGNGTTGWPPLDSPTPVTVTGLTNAVAIAAGGQHSCALLGDGSGRCWGDNARGQLGNGAEEGLEISSATPVTVVGFSGAVAITAGGGSHSCAVMGDGTARCWGDNQFGQLGTAVNGWPNTTPVAVTGLADAVAITAGVAHTCSLLGDGTVRCWGLNDSGQLGNGSTTSSSNPVAVTGLTGVVAVAAGGGFTCAVLGDGTGRCWGTNASGELGNGTTTGSTTPVTVSGLTDAVAITAGSSHACALLEDGTARCWGYLQFGGQLGDGTSAGSPTPVAVSGLGGSTAVSSGGHHTCAVLGDGTQRCWGSNLVGQLGDGIGTSYTTPVAVVGL